MTTIIGWALISFCIIGCGIAAWGWWFVTAQTRKDDLMRQEVREALAQPEHPALQSSIVLCDRHSTVSMDFCPDCRVESVVALTRPGYVVHS